MTLTIAFRDARDAVCSYAAASGYFDQVAAHEPKNAPGKGLGLFVFGSSFEPIPSSGLRSTSVRFVLNAQLRCSMTRQPEDDIDLDLLEAADWLCAGISGDFDLGAGIRAVDLLGQHGPGLGAVFGYISQDSHLYRVLDVAVPCLVNDVFTQGA
jgi:hypothetical protein